VTAIVFQCGGAIVEGVDIESGDVRIPTRVSGERIIKKTDLRMAPDDNRFFFRPLSFGKCSEDPNDKNILKDKNTGQLGSTIQDGEVKWLVCAHNGVLFQAAATYRFGQIIHITNAGCHVDGVPPSNANNWRIDGVTIADSGMGISTLGKEANNGLALDVSITGVGQNLISNGGHGVWEHSFLGNAYVKVRAEGNFPGAGFYLDNAGGQPSTLVHCYCEEGMTLENVGMGEHVVVGGTWGTGWTQESTCLLLIGHGTRNLYAANKPVADPARPALDDEMFLAYVGGRGKDDTQCFFQAQHINRADPHKTNLFPSGLAWGDRLKGAKFPDDPGPNFGKGWYAWAHQHHFQQVSFLLPGENAMWPELDGSDKTKPPVPRPVGDYRFCAVGPLMIANVGFGVDPITIDADTAPPTSGYWVEGSQRYNCMPLSQWLREHPQPNPPPRPRGWQCVERGTPGTWEPFF
jgi:hypothetical protein